MNRGFVDLAGRELVLDENFRVFIPNAGAGAGESPDWYVDTPWPFGSQHWQPALTNPGGAPFSVGSEGLTITATKNPDGSWNSGLICSVSDAHGSKGFRVLPGDYVEVTAKFPNAPGVWPSIWLNTVAPDGITDSTIEIDILEAPGNNPLIWQTVVHEWRGDVEVLPPALVTPQNAKDTLFDEFHSHGVHLGPEMLRFTFDRQVYWQTPTPAALVRPMGLVVSLAMGGGYPVPTVEGSLSMIVKAVKVYRPRV